MVFKPGAFLSPERPFSFHVRGHGDLLVYNGSAPDTLSRIGADGKPTVLRDDPSACCADSVSSGRIALRGARAVSVIDGTGRPVHVFAIPGDAARLDGERLVVARLGTLESYDVSSGAHVGSRALPAGYGLVDVHGGVAALRNGNAAIKLLRLADGRSFTLSPGKGPRFADLEGSGLYYSYGLASGEGRVVFLRRAAVERRLGS